MNFCKVHICTTALRSRYRKSALSGFRQASSHIYVTPHESAYPLTSAEGLLLGLLLQVFDFINIDSFSSMVGRILRGSHVFCPVESRPLDSGGNAKRMDLTPMIRLPDFANVIKF